MNRKKLRLLLKLGLIKRKFGWVVKSWEERERGYKDTNIIIEQSFMKRTVFLGCVNSNNVLFVEQVPYWAYFQQATLGLTDWRSNAPKHYHHYQAF